MTDDRYAALREWLDHGDGNRYPIDRKDARALLADADELEGVRALVAYACEEDTAIRNLCRPVLGDAAVDGDRYGVPTIFDVVRDVLARERARAERLAKALRAIEEGCSFPADSVQRAVRDRARAALTADEKEAR
jgi:hypothetical protein